jgi:hypothetical protein
MEGFVALSKLLGLLSYGGAVAIELAKDWTPGPSP